LWTVRATFPRLRALYGKWLEIHVGKGDRRTRRGKIYAGSFGKTRPKDPKAGKSPARPASASTASRPAAAKAPAKSARKAKA